MRTVPSYKKFFISASAVCVLGSGLLLASAQQAHAQLFISQIYGGGGGIDASASYTRDFVELYNGTGAAINLSGYTIQYAAAGNTSSPLAAGNVFALTFNGSTSIASGSYFLIATGTVGSGVSSLPTADATAGANISATSGKLFLANNNTPVSSAIGSNTPGTLSSNVVDFVGFGTANGYEGAGPAPIASITTSIARKSAPTNYTNLSDTNNNGADFFATAATPRNSSQTSLQPLDTPEPGTFALGLTALPIIGGIGLRRRALSRKARVAVYA